MSDGPAPPSLEIVEFEWRSTDVGMVCTDGLTHAVEHAQLEAIFQSGTDPRLLVTGLFDAVISAKPRDNTTVVLFGE